MSALDLDIRPLKTSSIRLNENFSVKASRAQQFDPCRSLFPRWAQPQAVPPLGASAPVIPKSSSVATGEGGDRRIGLVGIAFSIGLQAAGRRAAVDAK